jgi:20S proteasome subunit beta 7
MGMHNFRALTCTPILSRVMNHRRNKFDPLWNSVLIAGRDNGESFLGFVDLLGTSFVETAIATGFRRAHRAAAACAPPSTRCRPARSLSRDAAKELLERCMRVLFYRDARSLNKIQIG